MQWYWQGKPEVLVENPCASVTLSSTKFTWTGLRSNPGFRDDSPAIIFYGHHINFRHHSAMTAATCSGMIRHKTWGSQNGVNKHAILLACYALSTAKWFIKLWSKLLRYLWLLSLPPFSALLWTTWFLQLEGLLLLKILRYCNAGLCIAFT